MQYTFCDWLILLSIMSPRSIHAFAYCRILSSLKMTSLVAQMVKCPPTMRETRVRSLGWEDPLEKEMTTHSGTLAWRIPWMKEPGGLQSMGLQRVRHE